MSTQYVMKLVTGTFSISPVQTFKISSQASQNDLWFTFGGTVGGSMATTAPWFLVQPGTEVKVKGLSRGLRVLPVIFLMVLRFSPRHMQAG